MQNVILFETKTENTWNVFADIIIILSFQLFLYRLVDLVYRLHLLIELDIGIIMHKNGKQRQWIDRIGYVECLYLNEATTSIS